MRPQKLGAQEILVKADAERARGDEKKKEQPQGIRGLILIRIIAANSLVSATATEIAAFGARKRSKKSKPFMLEIRFFLHSRNDERSVLCWEDFFNSN